VPTSNIPRYRALADKLRERIQAGAIPPGALLPAEPELMAEFKVARGTVRQAIAVLRTDGLIVTEHGRGSYVRPTRPIRRLPADRYQRLFTRINADGQADPDDAEPPHPDRVVDEQITEVRATPELAELFDIEPGTTLVRRRTVTREYGVPIQFVTSYCRPGLTRAVSNPDPAVAGLDSLIEPPTFVTETIRARMPDPYEARVLRLPETAPVLAIVRRSASRAGIVEVAADIVLAGDHAEAEYVVRI